MRNLFEINYKDNICKTEYDKNVIIIVFPEDVCYYYKVEHPPNYRRLNYKQNLALLITL